MTRKACIRTFTSAKRMRVDPDILIARHRTISRDWDPCQAESIAWSDLKFILGSAPSPFD